MALTKSEINRRYREKNKEKISAINREYYQKNQERIVARNRSYYNNNVKNDREARNKTQRAYYQKQKDGYHRVYLLEDYNYVGVTSNIMNRFSSHKQQNGRDCTNHRILYKTKDRKEAEELEDLLHSLGYEGKHEGQFTKK